MTLVISMPRFTAFSEDVCMVRSKSRRVVRLLSQAWLAVVWLGLASCSEEGEVDEKTEALKTAAGIDLTTFVDPAYLETFCVISGIEYPITTEERSIQATNPVPTDATNVRLHKATMANALEIYPRRFLAEIGLRRIILCRGLSIDGISGHAFADVEHGTLFVDITTGLPDLSLKRSVHHEIFHFVDFAEDARLDEDPSWMSLNPSSFRYGAGGGSMQGDLEASSLNDSCPGFLNRYSTSGLAEDKAEVYATMMTDSPWILRRTSADSILRRKVERIRVALGRHGALAPDPLARAQSP